MRQPSSHTGSLRASGVSSTRLVPAIGAFPSTQTVLDAMPAGAEANLSPVDDVR